MPKKNEQRILIMWFVFAAIIMAFHSHAYSSQMALHHFYVSQVTGSPVYLSATIPEQSELFEEQSPSLKRQREKLDPGERLLLVKKKDIKAQRRFSQPAGLKLYLKNFLPNAYSCTFADLFSNVFPSVDINLSEDSEQIHRIKGEINPECSQIKTTGGEMIPFASISDSSAYPDDLILIEIPPLPPQKKPATTTKISECLKHQTQVAC